MLFGIRHFSGRCTVEPELWEMAQATDHYATDGLSVKVCGPAGMGFHPGRTYERDCSDVGLASDQCGNMLSLDGRIDNSSELACELDLAPTTVTVSQILLAGFRRWGSKLFSRLSGEWAAALWSSKECRLYLARDHVGSRTLFFRNDDDAIRWSTHLETLFVDRHALDLDIDFAARYLACLPLREVTPYRGIRSVLPAHYLIVETERTSQQAHWEWIPKERIRYNADSDYEESFFSLLKQAVARRTTDGVPVLAQLSGGIDSSSIVCMSDHTRRSQGRVDLLDTISFYDDTEPSWNERPYFTIIESYRRKKGVHIDAAFSDDPFDIHSGRPTLFPVAHGNSERQERELMAIYKQGNFRALLSGIGGDEMLGGIPDSLPELTDLLRSGRVTQFVGKAFVWCLADRSPLIGTILNTAKHALGTHYRSANLDNPIPPWVGQSVRARCIEAVRTDITDQYPKGSSAAAIENASSWWAVTESLPHLLPSISGVMEYRYPYLDKDLVSFILRIPREQLVRPGHRRSLMRRALKDIVPAEVLNRKRKAFRLRGPLLALQHSQWEIDKLLSNSQIGSCGLINEHDVRSALSRVAGGIDVDGWLPLTRAVALELWLKTSSRYVQV